MEQSRGSAGNLGYALLWVLGVPLPVLILMYLIST